MEKQWLVAYTRPQWERIVYKQLQGWYGLPGYCPFKKVKRQYSDRIKMIEVPVFKNYVFVQVSSYQEYLKVLQLDGVVNYVKYLGKAAVIKEDEMDFLKEFIEKHDQIALYDLQVGKVVLVTEGILKGQEGIVRNISDRKVILELPALGLKLEARTDQVSVGS